MADKVTYKGHEIAPAPLELQAGGWTHEGYIIEHKDDSVTETKVLADGHSETLEKAVEVIITECKRIIDKRS
jgi:hypothetical protein